MTSQISITMPGGMYGGLEELGHWDPTLKRHPPPKCYVIESRSEVRGHR